MIQGTPRVVCAAMPLQSAAVRCFGARGHLLPASWPTPARIMAQAAVRASDFGQDRERLRTGKIRIFHSRVEILHLERLYRKLFPIMRVTPRSSSGPRSWKQRVGSPRVSTALSLFRAERMKNERIARDARDAGALLAHVCHSTRGHGS